MSESDECYCVIMRNTVSSPFLEYFRKSSLRPLKGVLSIPYPYKVLEKIFPRLWHISPKFVSNNP